MNKKKKILILGLYLILALIFFIILKYPVDCVFKKLTGIPCPACGLTRAFKEIIRFNIVKSFSYNILGFPLFLSFAFIFIIDIYDLITNKDILTKVLKKIAKYYYIIIILLIISFIVNIIRGI